MVKRKRGADSLSIRHLEKFQEDISRALKEAKGFERQRMSKRQRDIDITAGKKEKLEREINVLKSLDLHQTARAHLYSSLLRIKPIANHDDLPEQLKKGVAKPELAEDERVVLHNVTSGLYNRDGVKKAVDKAITFVCEALDIPVPEKGKKGKRERKGKTQETQEPVPAPVKTEEGSEQADADDTDFEGFSADDDEDDDEATLKIEDLDSDKEVERENDFAAMDGLLGSSSDEDEDEERTRLWEKYRGKETVNLDDISISGGDSDGGDPHAADDDDDEDDEPSAKTKSTKKVTSRGVSLSPSPSPPPKRSKKAAAGRPTDSTFLPSLMGGYVSGSESASDVDLAPPKKRRGQRARRAIWEQKYGSNAKHIKDAANNKGRGRDDGWDMKRGAVDASDSRTPWKKGVKNPFSSASAGSGAGAGRSQQQETRRLPPPTKRDDEGPLHPSWEARKKAKESLKATSFAGSKVVFD
ncbi:Bud-site selection protein, BUD22 [Akanthomyces lecanii RCEF 1005]|uniref:Bud-site selection protein, BUD22 n=1 Tax=Akanthomyces lecanii RCEF 1005 TaxID=1081108 RepID=A0A168IKT3_CORDF|nr:Bud-site selection protein, BUD22 [Akanthomyces lecanii RCEF 1005]